MQKRSPRWVCDLKIPYEDYNPEEHGIVGNFENALHFLINRIKDNEGFYSPTLLEFDKIRGGDWYTSTRLELYGSHDDWCEDTEKRESKMAVFNPKHFSKTLVGFAREVLPPEEFKRWGEQGLHIMDQSLLEFIDEFRFDVGSALIVNTPWNGAFTQSGYRSGDFYGETYRNREVKQLTTEQMITVINTYRKMEQSRSDHRFGRALDVKSNTLTGHELRKKFIEREQYYFETYGINFVEVGTVRSGGKEVPMSWAHFGKRVDLGQGVQYWSPIAGFVTKDDVLVKGL